MKIENIVCHNYQTGNTQKHCLDIQEKSKGKIKTHIYGTTGIIRNAEDFRDKNVLFNGVLYMAEDIYCMLDGDVNVFIPGIMLRDDGEIIRPRCPMISATNKSDPTVDISNLKDAKKEKPDKTLVYINTPASMKAASDGVYNGTLALDLIKKLSKKNDSAKLALIGDKNVNLWIKKVASKNFPNFQIESIPRDYQCVICPSHVKIDPKKVIEKYNELVAKHGKDQVELSMHAEVSEELLDFGLENNAYFGGTGGIIKNILNSPKKHQMGITVEGVIEKARRENTDPSKVIWSPKQICPNMAFTTPQLIDKAMKLLEEKGPTIEIIYDRKEKPYYSIKILNKEQYEKDKPYIAAVKLTIKKDIAEKAKEALSTLL